MNESSSNYNVRSMTGYARSHRTFPSGEVAVTLKSVNHRALDLHFHLAEEIDFLEPALRGALREKLSRGHIDIRISLARTAATARAGLNVTLFHAYVAALRQAAEGLGFPAVQPDLNAMLRLPGMVAVPEEREPDPELESQVLAALNEALDTLNAFRAREGAEIAAVILRHNRAIRRHAAEMDEIRGRAVPALHARLTERLRELLHSVSLDPQRVAQEVALLADHGDIGEEIERLKIHSAHLDELLHQDGETGKRIDFLLQEMSRESNTILSKTSGIGELGLRITELALASKFDVEKIREHALNLE